MLRLSCGENWTIGLQSPKAGPGTSRCLAAVAVLPAGPSLTSRLRRIPTCALAQDQSRQEGPGARVLPSGRCLWARATRGTCHQSTAASCVHRCLTHSGAETRASNLLAP